MNVDWRRTRTLYERTIGRNPAAKLTVHTFPGANHNLHRAATAGCARWRRRPSGVPAEGYYEAELEWLRERVLECRRSRKLVANEMLSKLQFIKS